MVDVQGTTGINLFARVLPGDDYYHLWKAAELSKKTSSRFYFYNAHGSTEHALDDRVGMKSQGRQYSATNIAKTGFNLPGAENRAKGATMVLNVCLAGAMGSEIAKGSNSFVVATNGFVSAGTSGDTAHWEARTGLKAGTPRTHYDVYAPGGEKVEGLKITAVKEDANGKVTFEGDTEGYYFAAGSRVRHDVKCDDKGCR